KIVGYSLNIDEDAFLLQGSTTAQDFQTQCQLMCAGLLDPGYREEALWQFRKAVPELIQSLKHTPQGPMIELRSWLHGGDSRFSTADADKLNSYTLEDVRKWLGPELAKGHLELSIVGDFDTKTILPSLLATFGALPERASRPPVLSSARWIDFPKAPAQKKLTYASKVPQGIATTIWKTLPLRDNQRDFRRLNILADILGDRQREEIREKLGASYSPNVGAGGSEALEGVGYIMSQSIGKPEDLPLLQKTAIDLAAKMAQEGATQDEFTRAINPLLGMLEKSQRDNNYWLTTVLSRCQQDPERIELARNREKDYRSITLEQINTLARKYLAEKNALSISIQSE
ncbi:MAG TPA: insulinase family protein, partial [Luteolibacter sp.]|nr:insulinase family protein [Luteolibacter sp.]